MPQSLANILVHIIFSTKERRPLIDDAVRPALHAYMAGVLKGIESPALIINSVTDHVHILCLLSKNIPACKLVEEIKKSSSKWMKTQGVLSFAWQNGYAVPAVSHQMWLWFAATSKTSPSITGRLAFKRSCGNFWRNTRLNTMNATSGIKRVSPLQGLLAFCL